MSLLCGCFSPRPPSTKTNRVDVLPKDTQPTDVADPVSTSPQSGNKQAWTQRISRVAPSSQTPPAPTQPSHPAIIILGLDRAGKTTLVSQLTSHRHVLAPPTTSLCRHVLSVPVESTHKDVLVIDMPGGRQGRLLWDKLSLPQDGPKKAASPLPQVCYHPLALIYVISLSDPLRIALSIASLVRVSSSPPYAQPPLLVILNVPKPYPTRKHTSQDIRPQPVRSPSLLPHSLSPQSSSSSLPRIESLTKGDHATTPSCETITSDEDNNDDSLLKDTQERLSSTLAAYPSSRVLVCDLGNHDEVVPVEEWISGIIHTSSSTGIGITLESSQLNEEDEKGDHHHHHHLHKTSGARFW
eukprot:TRINITY_DN5792_c0_g1_i2.p1 TRINITY_DN5792_c0_g1~~TRINITY_DN5792_c0_g1_i2.p1  ORF type:complete len:354 (+),score=70.77 TRINITY_DN5792_c0_g1_i2:66-1127(+)